MSIFDDKLALGRSYEVQYANWVMLKCNARILPVYDYNGQLGDKAPKLQGISPNASLVVPDLLVCEDGATSWVEVKYKTRADWTRITNRLETGIPLRLWRDYEAVQEASGLPVQLVFIHGQEGEVRGNTINNLRLIKRVYEGNSMSYGGMVFFPYEMLPIITTLDELSQACLLYTSPSPRD